MIFGIALSIVIVFSAVALLRQFVRGIKHGDPFRPLTNGRRPNDGYGKQ